MFHRLALLSVVEQVRAYRATVRQTSVWSPGTVVNSYQRGGFDATRNSSRALHHSPGGRRGSGHRSPPDGPVRGTVEQF